jgi:hypothetical protein
VVEVGVVLLGAVERVGGERVLLVAVEGDRQVGERRRQVAAAVALGRGQAIDHGRVGLDGVVEAAQVHVRVAVQAQGHRVAGLDDPAGREAVIEGLARLLPAAQPEQREGQVVVVGMDAALGVDGGEVAEGVDGDGELAGLLGGLGQLGGHAGLIRGQLEGLLEAADGPVVGLLALRLAARLRARAQRAGPLEELVDLGLVRVGDVLPEVLAALALLRAGRDRGAEDQEEGDGLAHDGALIIRVGRSSARSPRRSP